MLLLLGCSVVTGWLPTAAPLAPTAGPWSFVDRDPQNRV